MFKSIDTDESTLFDRAIQRTIHNISDVKYNLLMWESGKTNSKIFHYAEDGTWVNEDTTRDDIQYEKNILEEYEFILAVLEDMKNK